MTLRKIISGGQTGADQGGLIAGELLGLETGGTAPYNWQTEVGNEEALLRSFGLEPGGYDARIYPKRTAANVKNSDGTALFGNTNSPGTRLTIRMCLQFHKPYIVPLTAKELAKWLQENNIEVLNVAGNRESKNPGIMGRTIRIITQSIRESI